MPPMSVSSLADLLKEVPLFSECSKKELRNLSRRAHERHVPPGQVLVHEGDAGDSFYVVVVGLAEVHRGGQKVGVVGPGDFFGDLALLDPAPRNATVTARTAMDVVVLDRAEFDAVTADSPGFVRELLVGLAHRLRGLDARAAD